MNKIFILTIITALFISTGCSHQYRMDKDVISWAPKSRQFTDSSSMLYALLVNLEMTVKDHNKKLRMLSDVKQNKCYKPIDILRFLHGHGIRATIVKRPAVLHHSDLRYDHFNQCKNKNYSLFYNAHGLKHNFLIVYPQGQENSRDKKEALIQPYKFNVIRTEFYPSDEDVIINYSGRVIDYLDQHFHNTSWEEDCLTCKRKQKYQSLYP